MDPQAGIRLVQLLRVYCMQRSLKKRRYGIHPINQRRKEAGQYHSLLDELKADEERFRQYTRMSRAAFSKLLDFVKPRLEKRSRREAIGPEGRLIICLRFLSSGSDFHSLSIAFRIGVSTTCNICHEVCAVLAELLSPVYLVTPSITDEWQEIADGFSGKWNVPNALGAIDGKHIRIKQPANSHSLYFNYKQFFSTVLIVVADYRSRIVYAHFGSYGHDSDAGIFDRSDLRRLLNDPANPLRLPAPIPLPGGDVPIPYFFIGDGAFALHKHMQRPFPQRNLTDEKRIYNYRISRARRVVESTFGIMASKWRILLKPIETSVKNADVIVKAICCLHNYLIAEGEAGQIVTEEELEVAEQLTQAVMRNPRTNNPPRDGQAIQNLLVDFFNGIFALEWQYEMM